MRPTIRVMLVDDHAMVRAGTARLLALEDDLQVVGSHADADSAYAALQPSPCPADVLVLDLSMPGRSGFDLMRRLRLRHPPLALLVCSMHDSPPMLAQALAAGAHGFVTKSSDPALLADAIRRVAAGATVLSPDLQAAADKPAARPPHEALSPREFEVLLMLARGDTVERIAQDLHLSAKRVANVQTLIRSKLGLGSAIDLLRYAREHRLTSG
ncbi:MAG: response regulator transcription factor [Rubrivivax sp.]|nr:response regulator transcription factor [Rubrivivax sp.]